MCEEAIYIVLKAQDTNIVNGEKINNKIHDMTALMDSQNDSETDINHRYH